MSTEIQCFAVQSNFSPSLSLHTKGGRRERERTGHLNTFDKNRGGVVHIGTDKQEEEEE